MARKTFTDNIVSTSAPTTSTAQQVSASNKTVRYTFTGTYTGATGVIQVSNDGVSYVNLLGIREDTGAGFTGSISAANFSVLANVSGWTYYRLNVTALATGTLVVTADEGSYSLPQGVTPIAVGSQSSTITSASANALAVGPAGVTNPALNVDASTGSAATGWNHVAAAAGSGVALAVISSGTNESGTIDAKGSGAIKINSVGGTGAIQFGGAASGNNATGLTVTPAAAASGLAVAVVSTGTDENLTVNAKGAGTIGIGSVSTGLIVLGRGVLKTPVLGLTKTDVNTQNAAPTIAQLLGGYVTHNSQTGAGTLTTPIGSAISGGIAGVATGDSFVVFYNNRGNQTVTLTAGDGNVTLRGTVAIPTLKSAILLFNCTGANTWDVCSTLSA